MTPDSSDLRFERYVQNTIELGLDHGHDLELVSGDARTRKFRCSNCQMDLTVGYGANGKLSRTGPAITTACPGPPSSTLAIAGVIGAAVAAVANNADVLTGWMG
jgi:hypothetical protein